MSFPIWAGFRGGKMTWYGVLYWWFRWFVYPRKRYPTHCTGCGKTTGKTMHAWAIEDRCRACFGWIDDLSEADE